MFKNVFQTGYLSLFYSLGSQPLQLWEVQEQGGTVTTVNDDILKSNVLQLDSDSNLATTCIACPADPARNLGIKLPILTLIVRNMQRFFSFEVQVLDDKNVRRRFRASNFQSITRIKPFICTMPLRLEDGWNMLQLDLADLVRKAYGTQYTETLRVQVHASCHVRRVFFSDKAYREEELPPEFRLYVPS